MVSNKKQFKDGLFCAAPAPLLWKGMFFFIPMLAVAVIALGIYAIMAMHKNKKSGKKILDKKIKTILIYFSVAFLSLMTYGIIGLDFNFYLLVFFMLSLYVIGAFFVGEHFKLFKVRQSAWIALTAAALIFGVMFIVCFLTYVSERKHVGNEPDMKCLNRDLF